VLLPVSAEYLHSTIGKIFVLFKSTAWAITLQHLSIKKKEKKRQEECIKHEN
jgi:hypothetical protein